MEINIGQQPFTLFNVIKPLTVLTASFFLALVLTPLWVKVMNKFKLGKQMRDSQSAPIFTNLHKNKAGTPTTGGVIVWGSILLLVVVLYLASVFLDGFWSKLNFLDRGQTWLPLAALVFAGLVGFADDLMGVFRVGPRGGGLTMKFRILLYVAVALAGAGWFYFKLCKHTVTVPLIGDFDVGWYYIPLFMFVLVSSAFSANETDGLDGLAAGVFLTMFAAYGVIAFDQGWMNLVAFIAAIIGALVAFLWHNIFPARFFMGDTGSMSLGIVLGVIAMLTRTPLLLIPIGFIFVIESLSVIIQVISKKIRGKKVFLSAPIHHHFEAKGWHETRVTMRFWMISMIGAIIGVMIFLVDSKIPALSGRHVVDGCPLSVQEMK